MWISWTPQIQVYICDIQSRALNNFYSSLGNLSVESERVKRKQIKQTRFMWFSCLGFSEWETSTDWRLYWDGYLIFLLPQSFAAEIPHLWAHCHSVVHLYQQTALPCSPLLFLREYNNFSVFLFLSLLSVTKKDIVKINHLGQGESIDSANSADAPSESKGERENWLEF